MTARPDHLTTALKISLASELLADPNLNKSALARDVGLSRQTLYSLALKGQHALSASFSALAPPAPLHQQGFFIWVDPNLIKRAIVTLRAACGATFSVIALALYEAFGLRLSHGEIWAVLAEAHQRAFDYLQTVSLQMIDRAAFDEMYRWDRCELVGVDCVSLFIFLSEKQPGCSAFQWVRVMERLQKVQGLNPSQIAVDGLSALKSAASSVWWQARIIHDINHLRRALDKVRAQFEGMGYQAIDAAARMRKRVALGPTRRTKPAKLALLLDAALAKENEAVTKAEVVSALIRQAQATLNVVHPETGKVQEVSDCQKQMEGLAAQIRSLGTCYAKAAADYLEGLGQKIVKERELHQTVMRELAKELKIEFSTIEAVVHLMEIGKQRAGAPWRGTKELLWKKMLVVQSALEKDLGTTGAIELTRVVSVHFEKILGASSAAEGAIQRLSAVMYPQKRPSSGFLYLRAAYLNLNEIEEGVRKGHSPHELMTGEVIEDWLEKLGYGPSQNETRSYKKQGWKRLVEPFEATWKKNYGGENAKVEAVVGPN